MNENSDILISGTAPPPVATVSGQEIPIQRAVSEATSEEEYLQALENIARDEGKRYNNVEELLEEIDNLPHRGGKSGLADRFRSRGSS